MNLKKQLKIAIIFLISKVKRPGTVFALRATPCHDGHPTWRQENVFVRSERTSCEIPIPKNIEVSRGYAKAGGEK